MTQTANETGDEEEDALLIRSLQLLDPILQFLTRATGQSMVPLATLRATLPKNKHNSLERHLESLIRHGILQVAPYERFERNPQEFMEQWNENSVPPPSSVTTTNTTSNAETVFSIGFPAPDPNQRLSGSTKTAAKRRMGALKQRLKKKRKQLTKHSPSDTDSTTTTTAHPKGQQEEEEQNNDDSNQVQSSSNDKNWELPTEEDPNYHEEVPAVVLEEEKEARTALEQLLGLKEEQRSRENLSNATSLSSLIPTTILPNQVSYAGSNPAQCATYYGDSSNDNDTNTEDDSWFQQLDSRVRNALLNPNGRRRRLYRHQADAIRSALQGISTLVCTGTGSGKSLSFLLPVVQAAVKGKRSLLLFPTKALAQDQLQKLLAWLQDHPSLQTTVRPATLDGDTPHSQRVDISLDANVILTNPDTLHAAILPNWKDLYQPIFSNNCLQYVVLDEAHMYQGVFGAHVAMILARLYRLTCCNNAITTDSSQLHKGGICFLACSATLPHPEHHFRLLCCIPKSTRVNIVTKDASPRAAKHFWVWNPPLLDINGKSLGIVKLSKRKKKNKTPSKEKGSSAIGSNAYQRPNCVAIFDKGPEDISSNETYSESVQDYLHGYYTKETKGKALQQSMNGRPQYVEQQQQIQASMVLRRRHSADETAYLLACAVSKGIRCIAFCKTRCLVEWVYERTLQALKESPKTAGLVSKVESYRGGYTKLERRQIEQRLFQNQLLGVVGTSALELGVDIGGVDLTLHCGFPSSHASLMQQAGRAGRGAAASERPSLAICVCFNSPIDQHLWRHPASLLTRGLTAPLSMPIYPGLVQGHLMCAGQEFPLTGQHNVAVLTSSSTPGQIKSSGLLSDENLFGSREVYQEALETVLAQGSVIKDSVAVPGSTTGQRLRVYKTHSVISNPWTKVSIRSMEPVNYDIVNMAHPGQGGRMDGIHDEAAVIDTMPYSRVFYHAFPGAIIMHRGRRYKIVSMTRPPAFGIACRGTTTLGAFAKPCNHRYYTRPLSTLKVTVVKQMERVDLSEVSMLSRTSLPGDKSKKIVGEIPEAPKASEVYSESVCDPSAGSFAGCGMVNVKRNVHGYKKLSMVTREELSRSELSLPDMEYDTFAFWLDCDPGVVAPTMTAQDYGYGIHALSHAILAVAPLFVPCVMSDVQCDHSYRNTTKVTIFDARAGGSGICAQLWKSVFVPNGLIEAAIGLMENCSSCSVDQGYQGGCPACLQAGECIKFNDFMCKSSGVVIAKHLLKRLKQTKLYQQNEEDDLGKERASKKARTQTCTDVAATSPRRKARERAMRTAKDIHFARQRQVVVGRPGWPLDRSDGSEQENSE